MVLSRGMKEGKEIPWFLTESKKAWQKASALPKSQTVWDMKRGQFFIQVKSVDRKKKRWVTMEPLWWNKAPLCVLSKVPKCDFKSELDYDDEIWGKDLQKKFHYIRADFMDWHCYGTDCIWLNLFNWTLSQFIEEPFREAIRPEIVDLITWLRGDQLKLNLRISSLMS